MEVKDIKVLMVNKFLHLCGGTETYMMKIGEFLKENGHEVEYFGMEHSNRCVGNSAEEYTSTMNFHKSKLQSLAYPFKIIYSFEARKKIRKVLKKFNPDVVHLNNFNFQLTPSIILEIKKYEKEINKKIKIVFTAHDYQLICPNHMMVNGKTNKNCEKCIDGKFLNCLKNKCIHGEFTKSLLGSIEGYFWRGINVYTHIDVVICPSQFMKEKIDTNKILKDKSIMIHNFIDEVKNYEISKENYVLYFGRFSKEKGIEKLIEVCRLLPGVRFVFAGAGPLEKEINRVKNIENVGFKQGKELENLIRNARFTIYPSEWYENCPFSVMESQMYGTPVIGANIGGIPELIKDGITGELFESGNVDELKNSIELLWNDIERNNKFINNCRSINFDSIAEYCEKLINIYRGKKYEDKNISCNT